MTSGRSIEVALTIALVVAVGAGRHAAASAAAQQSTVSSTQTRCTAATPSTPSETEGPYYKAGSPQRTSFLDKNAAGARLVLTGYVLSRGDCRPVPGVWLDFWQADDKGHYDNVGYQFRGHQVTDTAGRFTLQTVLPGLYPGRTRHIHVKVRTPGGATLTTQIYFPGESRNESDGLFNAALLAEVRDGADGKIATVNFIVDAR